MNDYYYSGVLDGSLIAGPFSLLVMNNFIG